MRRALPALLALLFGVGLGYLIFGRQPRTGSEETAGKRTPARGPTAKPKSSLRERAGARESSRRPNAVLDAAVRQRNAQLVAENKRLAARLHDLKQDLLFARGEPMAWPTNVPGRLTRKPLMRALNQALQQAGLSGEVTDVDCKEYPCVLSGSLQGRVGAERFQKILGTKALMPYEKDHAQTSVTTRTGNRSDGRPWVRSHFAIALMLSGPPGTDLDVRRTVYRLRQLLDAATGQQ